MCFFFFFLLTYGDDICGHGFGGGENSYRGIFIVPLCFCSFLFCSFFSCCCCCCCCFSFGVWGLVGSRGFLQWFSGAKKKILVCFFVIFHHHSSPLPWPSSCGSSLSRCNKASSNPPPPPQGFCACMGIFFFVEWGAEGEGTHGGSRRDWL